METDRTVFRDPSINAADSPNAVIYGYRHDDIYEEIRRGGCYFEGQILEKWLSCYEGAEIILDVGANLGNHTLYFSRHTKAGRIIAFEPYEKNFRMLKQNVRENHCRNVICEQLAVGRSASFAVPEKPVDPHFLGSIRYRCTDPADVNTSNAVNPDRVRIISLDEYAAENGLSGISFLKIDTEGFGRMVLEGTQRILERDKPAVWIELEENDGGFVYAALAEHGYILSDVCFMNALFVHPDRCPDAGKLTEADLLQLLMQRTDEMTDWKIRCQMAWDRLRRAGVEIGEHE